MTSATRPTSTKHNVAAAPIARIWTDRRDGSEWELRSDGSVARIGQSFLQATAQFTTAYGGRQVTIGRGERVIETHELATRYPGRFRPALSMRALAARAAGERAAEQRTAYLQGISATAATRTPAATPKRGYLAPVGKAPVRGLSTYLEPTYPIRVLDEVSPGTQRVNLRIGNAAHRVIVAEVDRHDGDAESGGGLYGSRIRSWHKDVFVGEATEIATAKRRDGCSISQAALEAGERRSAHEETRTFAIGTWHVHPSGGSDAVRSRPRALAQHP